jgi:nitrogen fixation NifU-like protein
MLEVRNAMPSASLYDDYLMDHIKNARNYRVLDKPDHTATASNPLCGDEITLYLELAEGRIDDVAFQCTCCGISMASASIMTELVKGVPEERARSLVREFEDLLTRDGSVDATALSEGRLALLDTVRRYPARAGCALLPWKTLEGALISRHDPVG